MPARKKIPTIAKIKETVSQITKPDKEDPVILLTSLRVQITKEVNNIIDLLIERSTDISTLKKQTEEISTAREKQKRQEEEEQRFNFLMELKKRQADFDEKLAKDKKDFNVEKEQELDRLKVKEENWKEKESEFQDLQRQVNLFAMRLEQAINEAKKQLTAVLNKEFVSVQELSSQKAEYNVKLLSQQLAALQQLGKQQDKEIQALKLEKTQAVDQMKELAVAVIKGKDVPGVSVKE